jgi:hypothetical protein
LPAFRGHAAEAGVRRDANGDVLKDLEPELDDLRAVSAFLGHAKVYSLTNDGVLLIVGLGYFLGEGRALFTDLSLNP